MGKIRRYDIKGDFKEEQALIDFKIDFKEHKAIKVLKRSSSQKPDKCMPTKELTLKPLRRPDEDEELPEDAPDKAVGAEEGQEETEEAKAAKDDALERFKEEVK